MKYPLLAVACALAAIGCSNLPGRPHAGPEVPRPDEVVDFATLYQQNCSGCHGAEGKEGAAMSLANPEYLALVDDNTLRRVIAQGVAGTPMPGFARSSGGMLTDAQIDVLSTQMRARWGKALAAFAPPPYAATSTGNARRGAQAYKTFCAACHGADGKGGTRTGSIVEPAYLSLVSNQGLRTTVIVGRPEWEAPDWRNDVPGHPMSDQDVTDVVAWLAAQRPAHSTPDPVSSDARSPKTGK